MLHVYVVNLKIKSHFSHGLKNLSIVASERERFRASSSFVLTGDLGDIFGCSLTVVFLKDRLSCKGKFKTLSNTEMELFAQVVTGFRDEFRILPNIQDGGFWYSKVFKNWKVLIIFAKTSILHVWQVLNKLENWLPKLRMFHF